MDHRDQPRPPSRAEILLLSLFAAHPDALHHVGELTATTDLIAMAPDELEKRLDELRSLHLVAPGPGPDTIELTPNAFALVLELVEERLTDNLLRQRTLQEQAEALIIWRLTHAE